MLIPYLRIGALFMGAHTDLLDVRVQLWKSLSFFASVLRVVYIPLMDIECGAT